MFNDLIKSLLHLVNPCDVKDIVVDYCKEVTEATTTPIDDIALQAVDVVLDNVLGCNQDVSRKSE